MPTRSSAMRSLTRESAAVRRSAHRLRELDPGQELVGVDLLAVHRLGHAHVGVHELDRRAHLLVVHPADAVLRVALGLHQLEPHHHVRLDDAQVDLGHTLLEDLERRLRALHHVAPAHVRSLQKRPQHPSPLLHRLLAGDDGHRVHVESMVAPRHHHGIAFAHRLFVEGHAGRVVGYGVHASLGEGGDLGGGLDVDPRHPTLVDPLAPASSLPHAPRVGSRPWSVARPGTPCRWPSPGGAPTVLPSRSLGLVMGASFQLHTLSGVLSNTMPTTLLFAPRPTAAITTALSASPTSARPVSTLAIESPEPLEFCISTSRPLAL